MLPWNACILEPNWVLKWIECHPGLAGYIQAVGVVATLTLSLLGPPLARALEIHRARIARRDMTTNIIIGSKTSVTTLLQRIEARLARIDDYGDDDGSAVTFMMNNLGVEIPGALDMQFIDDENFERGRLEFLANLTNAARSYNMSIMEIVQNQEIVGGLGAGASPASRKAGRP